MYRVELKDDDCEEVRRLFSFVPNVPCGVERELSLAWSNASSGVPNVPCGVERLHINPVM